MPPAPFPPRPTGPTGSGRVLEVAGWWVNLAGVVIAAGWFVALFVPHLKMIAQPGPQEYNEPAIWRVTWLLDHGRNPYTAKELPGAAYYFDPFYNYVMRALEPILGSDYTAYRVFNLILLVACLGLLVRLICRAGAGLGIALLSAVFYYWMCLGNIMITARPDLLGLLFFLLGVFLPWEKNYSRWSTVAGLACALVAFHCKSYFALAGCATLLGHFLLRSVRDAWWLGIGFFSLLGLTFAGCCLLFPYYYIETVVVQQGGAALNSTDAISTMHTVMFFARGWPFLVVMLTGGGLWLWRGRAYGAEAEADRGNRVQVLAAVFVIFLGLVYFYMGRNAGAYFTYHLHLLFPLMFVLAAHAVRRPWLKVGFGVLLAGFVMTRLHVPPMPDSSAPYRRMEQLVQYCPGQVLGIASMTDILDRTGRRVLHDGNTMYVGFAFANHGADRDPMVGALWDNYKATEAEVTRKVAAREYALVFTEFDQPYFCTTGLLEANYDRVEQIDYYTYFGHSPVRVWRPKPR